MGSPTWYGAQATKLQGSPVSSLVEEGNLKGRVQSLHDVFTLAGALTSADVILMSGLLPEGARIIGAKLAWGAQGGSGALSLGWQASAVQANGASEDAAPHALLNDVAAATAGGADMFATNPQAAGYQYVLAAPVQPIITVDVAGTATTGTIDAIIEFVID